MKKHLILITLHLASCASDYYYTNRNAHQPVFHEADPLARVFVTHGNTLRTGYFVATSVATLTFDHYLRKHGHAGQIAGDFVLTQEIINNAYGAASSAQNFNSIKKGESR